MTNELKDDAMIQAGVARLIAEKHKRDARDNEAEEVGKKIGKEWACNKASLEQLERINAYNGTHTFKYMDRDKMNARDVLLHILCKGGSTEEKAGIMAACFGDKAYTPSFFELAGFIYGAKEIYWKPGILS